MFHDGGNDGIQAERDDGRNQTNDCEAAIEWKQSKRDEKEQTQREPQRNSRSIDGEMWRPVKGVAVEEQTNAGSDGRDKPITQPGCKRARKELHVGGCRASFTRRVRKRLTSKGLPPATGGQPSIQVEVCHYLSASIRRR